ncbi:PREDICTED: caspase-1-like, partial [Rhagoletis zephyria]
IKKDFTNYSCLVIAILSHGSAHDSVAASDGEYNVDETMLHPILDIPSLKEKPKIFIIQACKGSLVPGEYKKDASMPRGSPSEILKCYSTFEGYVSYRTEKGSPFVQALCDEIKLKGQSTDIEQLMKNAIEAVKIQTR